MKKEMSNSKNIILSFSTGIGGIIFSNILSFISVPLILNYWGEEKYGVWALINTIVIYLNVSNLGMDVATSILMGKNNKIGNKIIILKRAFKIIMISIFFTFLIFLSINTLNKSWINILGNIPDILYEEVFKTCLIIGMFFLINLPFSLITAAFGGFQKVYINNVFNFVDRTFSFIALLVLVYTKGSLVQYAIYTGFFKIMINLIKLIYFIKTTYPTKEELNDVDLNDVDVNYKTIFITGIRFFLVGLASMLLWNTDNIIISNFMNLSLVTSYSITYKLYFIVITLIFSITGPLGPIVAKEFGKNNWEWINKTYNKFLILLSIIGSLAWIGGVALFKEIILLWSGPSGFAGNGVVFFLGAYIYLLSISTCSATLINAFNYTKNIYILTILESLINIVASITLLKYIGLTGVAVGTLLSSILFAFWIYPYLLFIRSNKRVKLEKEYIIKKTLLILPFLGAASIINTINLSLFFKVIFTLILFLLDLIITYKILDNENKLVFLSKVSKLKKGISDAKNKIKNFS